jgi:hypothetical protein
VVVCLSLLLRYTKQCTLLKNLFEILYTARAKTKVIIQKILFALRRSTNNVYGCASTHIEPQVQAIVKEFGNRIQTQHLCKTPATV